MNYMSNGYCSQQAATAIEFNWRRDYKSKSSIWNWNEEKCVMENDAGISAEID